MIERLSVQYPLKDCCLALNVSRSGYYQWTEAQPSARALKERELSQELEKLFKDNRGRYGSPRMTRALRQNGYGVGKNRVARLMRERKLAARKKRAFRPKTTRSVKVAVPNQIADLEALAPDQIWASDITYVATAEGWLYLAVILDLFSRRVVGWKLSESLDASLVCTALQNALVLRQPAKGLYFHSDRGSQYASHRCKRSSKPSKPSPV